MAQPNPPLRTAEPRTLPPSGERAGLAHAPTVLVDKAEAPLAVHRRFVVVVQAQAEAGLGAGLVAVDGNDGDLIPGDMCARLDLPGGTGYRVAGVPTGADDRPDPLSVASEEPKRFP